MCENIKAGLILWPIVSSLRCRHNGCDDVSNHQPDDCLLNRLFRHRSKKASKFRVTGLCVGNSPENGEFPAQMAGNAENVSIWWRHHDGVGFVICIIGLHVMLLPSRLRYLYLVSDHVSKASTNDRRRHICDVFSHWLRPCSRDLR